MSGYIELENADVSWFLSLNRQDLPKTCIEQNKTTYRSITYDDNEIQFSDGFTELHTKVYQETLAGRGFGIEDARNSIELVYNIRKSEIYPNPTELHYLNNSCKSV
jgi:UDP-N-acetyl-2-amino-2-deoxyglucuronate dehydrogenase